MARSKAKIATIVGARPQFIKAAPLSLQLAAAEDLHEVTIHTGQHFDENMSDIFFRELGLPRPAFMLDIHGGTHAQMTGRMLIAVEETLTEVGPDAVLVYGDTNSTLAGALAAAKLGIPVIHVEAGLRSFNRAMPEEINRVMTDHLSSILFCPTSTSVENLFLEGIKTGVHQVGDLMYDATLAFTPVALARSNIAERLKLSPRAYGIATLHRAENTNDPADLLKAADYLRTLSATIPLVFPVHPRTKSAITSLGFDLGGNILTIDPIGYFDMQALLSNAELVATDSGGLQKEAYFHRVPCVTMRSETEWLETIENGWNKLWEGGDYNARREILEYGNGHSAKLMAEALSFALLRP